MSKKVKGTIEFNNFLTETVTICRFRHTEPAEIEFKAGQYALVIVNDRDKRAYSIASSPEHKEYFDFYVDISPGGVGSKFFESLKEGDEVEYFAPIGRFFYIENEKPALFISTGTGNAPFFSMVESALINGEKKTIRMLNGFRYKNLVFGKDRLDDLAKTYPNFTHDICLSKDNQDGYKKGRVTAHLEEEVKNLGTDIDVYVCGGKEMILDVEKNLIALGVPKENIRYEKYF